MVHVVSPIQDIESIKHRYIILTDLPIQKAIALLETVKTELDQRVLVWKDWQW